MPMNTSHSMFYPIYYSLVDSAAASADLVVSAVLAEDLLITTTTEGLEVIPIAVADITPPDIVDMEVLERCLANKR